MTELKTRYEATDMTAVAAAIEQLGQRIATGLKYLGTGETGSPMGAIEFHATQVKEGAECIADALTQVAQAINRLAEAVESHRS